MRDFLFHDLIVRGTTCNLKCSYCTSTSDADQYEASSATVDFANGRRNLIDCDKALGMVDAFLARASAPLLKVSGGEMFLFLNAVDLVEELSRRYSYVQLLTNGIPLTEALISRIARLGNVGFNLSLDGHTPEMNAARWKSDAISRKVVKTLAQILEHVGEVEITTVVTDVNAATYPDFLEFLTRQPGAPVSVPVPVRGVNAQTLFQAGPRAAFADLLPRLVEPYTKVLGPPAYYLRLARFLSEERGVRQQRCHVPYFSTQLFDSGTVTPCPVGWTVSLGNVWEEGADAVFAQVGRHKMYDLLTRARPRVPVCRSCFSLSDIANLFLEGEVSIEQISRVPMYRPQPIQQRLLEFRERVRRTGSANSNQVEP
ncbi:MAG: radical SAM protein [Archangium sp.]